MEILKVKNMYFKNHTHYSYNLNKPLKMIVNIGWLSSEHSYEMGDTEPEFIEKLTEIISNDDIYDYTFNRIRCNTPCNLCKESILQPYINKKRNLPARIPLGYCELLIPSQVTNQYYASPDLILHYIRDHYYKPPQEYIDSVMALDLTRPFNAQDCFEYQYFKDNRILSQLLNTLLDDFIKLRNILIAEQDNTWLSAINRTIADISSAIEDTSSADYFIESARDNYYSIQRRYYGFAEFHIWRENFEERKPLNEALDQLKQKIDDDFNAISDFFKK